MNFHPLDSESSTGSSLTFQTSSLLNRKVAALALVALVAGLTIGILIGHFGISKDSDDNNNGGTSGGISGTDPPETSTTASSARTTTSSEVTTVSSSQTTMSPERTMSTASPEMTTAEMTNPTTSSPDVTTDLPGMTTSIPEMTKTSSIGTASSPGGTTSLPETTTSSPDGVFLPGVPASIIREANESVTDWILEEMDPDNIRTYLRNLTSEPHIAGTDMDFTQADMLRQFWLDVGFDNAATTPYDVLLSYPDDVIPNMVRIISSGGGVEEVVVETPENEENLTPDEWGDFPFPNVAYAGNGTVRGTLVYVNYGRLSDWETLETLNVSRHGQGALVYVNYGRLSDWETLEGLNVSVNGTIVLARYGGAWRAEMLLHAERRGAAGMIFYTDPWDYIPAQATDYYNQSMWMPPGATARGSVFYGTGDPLTPRYPSIASAYRYPEDSQEASLPKIPAMPIGYGTAQQILRLLDGEEAPDGWSGSLLNGTAYRLGPGFINDTLIAELSVRMTNERRKTYNAFGMIRGETEPDRYVLLGNHRDSWVLGAIDPTGGTATMMELARVLGALVKQGWWRPRRSIIFCSWAAEEFGLIGSTEWVEENIRILDYRTVAYLNLDIAVTGNWTARGVGSPLLVSAMYSAAQKVPYPLADGSNYTTVYDVWLDRQNLLDPDTGKALGRPRIRAPSDGSDYGTFQLYAGIPCGDFRYDQDFAGQNISFYSLYHTSYETMYAVENFIDPGFELHTAVGKLIGELLRDLSDAKMLPFNVSDYATYLQQTREPLTNHTDTLHGYNVNITQLDAAIAMYEEAARNFHATMEQVNTNNPFAIRRVNDQLMQIDRLFVDPAGQSLPGRSFTYRHLVHSVPGTAGIGARTFPGIADALFKLNRAPADPGLIRDLQQQFSVVVLTIQSAAFSLRETTDIFREAL